MTGPSQANPSISTTETYDLKNNIMVLSLWKLDGIRKGLLDYAEGRTDMVNSPSDTLV